MKTAYFRFYANLNDFISREIGNKIKTYTYRGRQTVKDCIESMGVPHPEVSLIIRNRRIEDFSALIKPGDMVSVYPAFSGIELPAEQRLRPSYKGRARFVLDTHLGKLTRYLRMLGFDALYKNDYDDPRLADISSNKQRILLTRDLGLLKRKQVIYGYYVRSDEPRQQLVEVLQRYQLFEEFESMGRCVECNTVLEKIDKEQIIDRLEPKTKKYFNNFRICPECNKIFWKGSHYQEMCDFIQKLKEQKYELAR